MFGVPPPPTAIIVDEDVAGAFDLADGREVRRAVALGRQAHLPRMVSGMEWHEQGNADIYFSNLSEKAAEYSALIRGDVQSKHGTKRGRRSARDVNHSATSPVIICSI